MVPYEDKEFYHKTLYTSYGIVQSQVAINSSEPEGL